MAKRYFKLTTGKGKNRIWTIRRKNDEVFIAWWAEGSDKIQKTSQKLESSNVGKANEKDAVRMAAEEKLRQIKMRMRQGYREFDRDTGDFIGQVGGDETVKFGESINFDEDLPQNFRAHKPQNSLTAQIKNKMKASQKAVYTRKRDGNMFTAKIDSSRHCELYSSTSTVHPKGEPDKKWRERFGEMSKQIENTFKSKSLIYGEIVASIDVDDRDYVSKVLRSKTDKALETQALDGDLVFCAWDIVYYDGRFVFGEKTYLERITFLMEVGGDGEEEDWGNNENPLFITATPFWFNDSKVAMDLAKENGWEGFVIADPEAIWGSDYISFNGRQQRPPSLCKFKPVWECDFICRWDPDNGIGTRGKGSRAGGVGSLALYLLDGEEEIFISNTSGMKLKQVFEYANPSLYPMVCEVEFNGLTKDLSLDFPRFIRMRDSKTVKECTMDQLPEDAKK